MDKSWTDKIPNAFGPKDKVFAGHPLEVKHAREMLLNAFEEDVGFAEYCGIIQKWLIENYPSDEGNQTSRADFINTQMEQVRNLGSYFTAD